MLTRLSAMLPVAVRGMWIGTFHGLCNRFLRAHWKLAGLPQGFQILDKSDQLSAVKRVIKGLPLVVLRFFSVYGPRQRPDMAYNRFIKALIEDQPISLYGDGRQVRGNTYIDDCVRAVALGADAPIGEVFNIGRTEENFRIIDIAELVAAAVPGSRIVRSSGAAPDARSYRVDFSKAAAGLPGFQPRWTVPAGIDQLYRAFSAANLTGLEFEHARYSRVAKICSLLQSGTLDASLRWRSAIPLPA